MQTPLIFEWGNIKFSTAVHQAYYYISYLKSPMNSDNSFLIHSGSQTNFRATNMCSLQSNHTYFVSNRTIVDHERALLTFI